jgi:hypothetical protein
MMSGIVAKAGLLLYAFAEAWPPALPLTTLYIGVGHLAVGTSL